MRINLALSPDSSSEAFLREVDENLRRDQAQAFAKRYATMIAGAALLFLAAVGGWLYWQDRQAKAAAADSETLNAALTDIGAERTATVGPTLDKLADSSSEGIATEARLPAASATEAWASRASVAIPSDGLLVNLSSVGPTVAVRLASISAIAALSVSLSTAAILVWRSCQ